MTSQASSSSFTPVVVEQGGAARAGLLGTPPMHPAHARWLSLDRMTLLASVPAQLSIRERVLLYAMVFGIGPKRCLEVGVAQGGGSRIIHAALSDLILSGISEGRLVGLDPDPKLDFDWATISPRATLIRGYSPDDLPRAVQAAGGLFDFVFLDGNHSREPVRRDLEGLVSATSPGASILCHDAFNDDVMAGVRDAIKGGCPFVDIGVMVDHYAVDAQGQKWAGMRLLKRV